MNKETVTLTITSLLSNLLLTFHLADDIVRGSEKAQLSNLVAVPIVVIWLYATLLLRERWSGYIIIILFSLFALLVPILHMRWHGVRLTSRVGNTTGAFF